MLPWRPTLEMIPVHEKLAAGCTYVNIYKAIKSMQERLPMLICMCATVESTEILQTQKLETLLAILSWCVLVPGSTVIQHIIFNGKYVIIGGSLEQNPL